MNPRYHDLAAAELARLTEANLEALMLALSRSPDAETIATAAGTWYSNPAIISPMFNGVVRASCAPEQAGELIDQALAYFTQRGRPLAFWWVGPSARPADLGARLLARGFAPFEVDAPSMACDLHALPERAETPAGYALEIVRDAESAQAWADTFNAIYATPQFAGQAWADAIAHFGYGAAPFQMYLGRLDGRPVATNILFCGAGVASVFGVGTLPEARGQGIGAAITLQPYLDARAQGYHTGVLFATEAGLPVYRRLGFAEVGSISRYLWRAG